MGVCPQAAGRRLLLGLSESCGLADTGGTQLGGQIDTGVQLAERVLLIGTREARGAANAGIPDVAGVVMKPTEAGAAIAEAIPSPTVAVAGTQAAANVAEK